MRSRCADLPAARARRPSRGARGAAPGRCPYLFDWPDEGGLDRPSPRPRVSLRLSPDAPPCDVVEVVFDFGRVVVVLLLAAFDFGRVVVVVLLAAADLGRVVVVDDLDVEPLAVVVVVDDLVVA